MQVLGTAVIQTHHVFVVNFKTGKPGRVVNPAVIVWGCSSPSNRVVGLFQPDRVGEGLHL